MKDLSITIISWNTKNLLRRCLHSIYDDTSGIEFEIFVVDNASSDGSSEMITKEFPKVNLIQNERNLGFAKACNQCIKLAEGRYILLLNSDTVVLPNALAKMVEFMDAHPKAGAVGCGLLNPDGSIQLSYAKFPNLTSAVLGFDWRRGGRPHRERNCCKLEGVLEVDWVGGACLMARREAIETVGLLDENFFLYGEETDWCYRMKREGWKIFYLPQSEVIHLGGQSTRLNNLTALIELHKSQYLFYKKYHSRPLTRLFKMVMVLGCVLKIGGSYLSWLLDSQKRGAVKEKLELDLAVLREALTWR